MLSSTRNEDVQINQNIHNFKSSYVYDSQFNSHLETPYSESSICCFMSKIELKCLRDPIASRVTLVNIIIWLIVFAILKFINFLYIYRYTLMEV